MTSHTPAAGLVLLLNAGLLLSCSLGSGHPQSLTARDSSAIDSVRAAYVSAWLADDTLGVLATLDSAAVLLPPGWLPVTGHQAIRAYWWPADGSHTTITAFTWTLEELDGTRDLAFTRGLSDLAWRYVKDTVRTEQASRNTNLTILRRGKDGRWRITRQMWRRSGVGHERSATY